MRYDLALMVVGLAALGAAVLPHLLSDRPLSFPVVHVALGFVGFTLLPSQAPEVLENVEIAEMLTEFAVIVSLMGAGLKLNRPLGWKRWQTTWRLLAITMPLSIGLTALLGGWIGGLSVASALLLGAVVAPTDPVLAADVQVGPPDDEAEDEVRFSLTSEAGLNDALAFPFVNAAIAASIGFTAREWVTEWLLIDVLYKLAAAGLCGYVAGKLLGRLLFAEPEDGERNRLRLTTDGLVALGATLLTYGATELVNGYGFLAVFIAAVSIRSYERSHEYHQVLHDFADQVERLVAAILLILFGGTIAAGLFTALDVEGVLIALAVLFLVRPLAGLLGLWGWPAPRVEKAAIAFYGIRGIGSMYYLSYALHESAFPEAAEVAATVGFLILLSIVVHGVSATPAMRLLERHDEAGAAS